MIKKLALEFITWFHYALYIQRSYPKSWQWGSKVFCPMSSQPRSFFFLGGRFIHKTVGIVQEVLHSIKRKKQSTIAMNNNISKAYDHTYWIDLRLLLTNIGFHMIQSVSFIVLINWSASSFFRSCRGSIKVSHFPLVSSYWSQKSLVIPLLHQKDIGTLSSFKREA